MNPRKAKAHVIGGQAVHVGDCHVWAEIYYLESPTDYREYILNDGGRQYVPEEHELVMLSAAPSIWAKARNVILEILKARALRTARELTGRDKSLLIH